MKTKKHPSSSFNEGIEAKNHLSNTENNKENHIENIKIIKSEHENNVQ